MALLQAFSNPIQSPYSRPHYWLTIAPMQAYNGLLYACNSLVADLQWPYSIALLQPYCRPPMALFNRPTVGIFVPAREVSGGSLGNRVCVCVCVRVCVCVCVLGGKCVL